jgi:hypothetical protein
MITKIFEVRDRATFIPVFAMKMQPDNEGQRYLLRRAGYSCHPDDPIVMLGYLGKGSCNYDPYAWRGSRTMQVAHQYIQKNFNDLSNGDVIDVEFILYETSEPKESERITAL